MTAKELIQVIEKEIAENGNADYPIVLAVTECDCSDRYFDSDIIVKSTYDSNTHFNCQVIVIRN